MSGRKCPAARIGLFDIVRDDRTKCPRVGFLAEQSHRRVGRGKKPPRAGPAFVETKPTRRILVLGERSEANEVDLGFGRTKRSQRGGSWFWENEAKPKRAGSWFWPNKPTGRNRAWGGPYLIASGLRSQTSFGDLRIFTPAPSRPRGSFAGLARLSATVADANHRADGKDLVVVDAEVPLSVCRNGHACIRRRGRRKQARPEQDHDRTHCHLFVGRGGSVKHRPGSLFVDHGMHDAFGSIRGFGVSKILLFERFACACFLAGAFIHHSLASARRTMSPTSGDSDVAAATRCNACSASAAAAGLQHAPALERGEQPRRELRILRIERQHRIDDESRSPRRRRG